MRINMEGFMIYLIRHDHDIDDYYDSRHDEIRNSKNDVALSFGSDIEPPAFISWEYENASDCY